MAKELLNNCGVWIGPYALSSVANSCELSGEADTIDVTTFGAAYREYLIGLKGVRFAGAGFYDPEVADAALNAEWGLNNQVITMAADNAVGGVAYFLRGCEAQYSVGGTVGQAATWSMSGQSGSPPLVRGKVLHIASAEDTSDDGAGIEFPAVASDESIYAVLHVTAVDGTLPELDVIIESDSADTFGSPTTRLTFSTADAVGAQWVSAGPAAITDTYWRASWTVGGTSPEFSFTIAFGIL